MPSSGHHRGRPRIQDQATIERLIHGVNASPMNTVNHPKTPSDYQAQIVGRLAQERANGADVVGPIKDAAQQAAKDLTAAAVPTNKKTFIPGKKGPRWRFQNLPRSIPKPSGTKHFWSVIQITKPGASRGTASGIGLDESGTLLFFTAAEHRPLTDTEIETLDSAGIISNSVPKGVSSFDELIWRGQSHQPSHGLVDIIQRSAAAHINNQRPLPTGATPPPPPMTP